MEALGKGSTQTQLCERQGRKAAGSRGDPDRGWMVERPQPRQGHLRKQKASTAGSRTAGDTEENCGSMTALHFYEMRKDSWIDGFSHKWRTPSKPHAVQVPQGTM